MSPPLKTPSTERDPIPPDPPLRYSSRHRITSGREDSEHGKRGRPRGDRRSGGLHKEPRELKRDRNEDEREGMETTGGRKEEREREGKERAGEQSVRAEHNGPPRRFGNVETHDPE